MSFDETRLRSTDKSAVASNEPLNIVPITIMYDGETGEPQNVQDLKVGNIDQQANIATVPWKEWHRGRVAQSFQCPHRLDQEL